MQQAANEVCDGRDNDCDGYVDETFVDADGAADGEFVRPAVVALSDSGPWVFAYEASRPDATCDYDFFKVSGDFRLFDSGFRCCFDQDPSQ